jgi:hypothetical protein
MIQERLVYSADERNTLMDTGLMLPQSNRSTTTNSPLLEQFRAVLSPTGGSPPTLEEKLAALSEAELQSIMQTAKFVQMAMAMKVAADDRTIGWADLVQSMYGRMDRYNECYYFHSTIP